MIRRRTMNHQNQHLHSTNHYSVKWRWHWTTSKNHHKEPHILWTGIVLFVSVLIHMYEWWQHIFVLILFNGYKLLMVYGYWSCLRIGLFHLYLWCINWYSRICIIRGDREKRDVGSNDNSSSSRVIEAVWKVCWLCHWNVSCRMSIEVYLLLV